MLFADSYFTWYQVHPDPASLLQNALIVQLAKEGNTETGQQEPSIPVVVG